MSDALEGSEPPRAETGGEIVGFFGEIVDERVASEGATGGGLECLHDCGRLLREVIPLVDREAGGLDDGAQLVSGY
jgi:hypothetical protein